MAERLLVSRLVHNAVQNQHIVMHSAKPKRLAIVNHYHDHPSSGWPCGAGPALGRNLFSGVALA
jgi:hypothetical protein